MINEQFHHGHIPIRPLAYKNKDKALTSELMVDYGNTGTENFHVYITDSNDPSKVIDLTQLMLEEIFPKAGIDANKFTITMDNEENALYLKDIIEFIYKRFVYPEAESTFNYERDRHKIINENRRDTLLRDIDGNIVTPITTADNVLLPDGKSLQDNFSNATRITISVTNFIHELNAGSDFSGVYPIEDYDGYTEVRYNGIYLSKDEYYIESHEDNTYSLHISSGIDLMAGDRIDVIFMYNTIASDDLRKSIDGRHIAIGSIPSSRLEKLSDSVFTDDPTTVASSRSVSNLFFIISDMLDEINHGIVYCIDKSDYSTYIHIDSIYDITEMKYCVVNVLLRTKKRYDCTVLVKYQGDAKANVPIKLYDDSDLNGTLPAGKVIKLIWDKDYGCFRLMSNSVNQLNSVRYVHRCHDCEEKITYDRMEYIAGALIVVYKNGLRLFEDIDYSINKGDEYITLFTPTDAGDVLVFEALSL